MVLTSFSIQPVILNPAFSLSSPTPPVISAYVDPLKGLCGKELEKLNKMEMRHYMLKSSQLSLRTVEKSKAAQKNLWQGF